MCAKAQKCNWGHCSNQASLVAAQADYPQKTEIILCRSCFTWWNSDSNSPKERLVVIKWI